MPKVSVVIPSYNCGHLITTAIESVLQQTFTDFEIIVVDDGSSDGTAALLSPFIQKGIIHYFYQKNQGVPVARNVGIELARGDFIFLLDADDQIKPFALEECVLAVDRDQTEWVICDIERVEDDVSVIQRAELPSADLFRDILRRKAVFYSFFCARKTLIDIGKYDPQQKNHEDLDLHIRLASKRVPFSYVTKPLYVYQKRKGSITKPEVARKKFLYSERIYRKHYKPLADSGDAEVVKLYAILMWRLGSNYFHCARSVVDAFRCFFESVRYDRELVFGYFRKISIGLLGKVQGKV